MLNMKLGSTALGARFAGLGVATALALSVSVVPGIALADEADAPAVTEPAPIEQVVAADVTPEAVVADAMLPATEEAPASEVAQATEQAEPMTEQPFQMTESASSETTSEGNGETTNPEKTTTEVTDDPATKGEEDVKPAAEEDPKGSEETGADAQKDSAEKQTTESDVTKAEATEVTGATKTAEDAPAATVEAARKLTNVYRVYNPNSGEHFFTASEGEALHLSSIGWRWEGIAYECDAASGAAVYRVYNPNAGAHFYTTNKGEANHLVSVGWKREGIAWYSTGSNQLYRLYNPNSPIGEHLYTVSAAERDSVRAAGWRYEGLAWSVVAGHIPIAPRWTISPAWGSQERYWIQSNGQFAKNRYIEASEGSGYRAYATSSGAVVRNKTKVGGGVMFADNNGRLKTVKKGWLVTKDFDGALQRYYITDLGGGRIGAKTGYFTVSGTRYYGYYNDGYVARNTVIGDGNNAYEANNDGVLTGASGYKLAGYRYARNVGSSTGWIVLTDTGNFRTMVFRKRSGNDPWSMEMDALCGVGAVGMDTSYGYHRILRKRPFKDNGWEIEYYLIDYIIVRDEAQSYHSIIYRSGTNDRVVTGSGLGTRVSHGCIRLPKENVKFIFDNCPLYSSIYIY